MTFSSGEIRPDNIMDETLKFDSLDPDGSSTVAAECLLSLCEGYPQWEPAVRAMVEKVLAGLSARHANAK